MWKNSGDIRKLCMTLPISANYLCKTTKIRPFFNFQSLSNKTKIYKRKELVGYTMQQMYDVVADVENYKSFVPYCKKSTVYNKTKISAKGDILVGFPPLHESYICDITYNMPNYIKSECFDGRLFNHLVNYWGFSAGVKDVPSSCVIDFQVIFEFKSVIHSNLSHMFFDLLVKQMEGAFIAEARRRYGKPKIKSLLLTVESS